MGDGGRWGIRPPVQVTEKVDLESNWKLPMLKAWVGVTFSVFMFLAASGVLAWLIPPDVALEVAFWVFVGMGIIFAVIGIIRWMDPNPSFFYGFVGAVLAFAAVWGVGSLPDTWWIGGQGILTWIQASALLSVMMGGGAGAYWFIKELIRQYELTGRELLQKELAEREMDRAELQADREWKLKQAALEPSKVWHVEITHVTEAGEPMNKTTFLEFTGVDQGKFSVFAANCLAGQEPTYACFAGKGKVFTRAQFDQITAKLEERKLLVRKGDAPNSPLIFSQGGLSFLREWLKEFDAAEKENEAV